jgi:c-di-GMP-binding flagellar brake protein YcgR
MLGLMNRFLAPKSPIKRQPPAPLDSLPQDTDNRYQFIQNPHQIERTLNALIEHGQPIIVESRGLKRTFQAAIKHANATDSQLLIGQRWNDDEHAALLEDGYLNLCANHDGASYLFSLHLTGTTVHNSSKCYRLNWPTLMLVVQMRDSLRIPTRGQWQGQLMGTLTDQSVFNARISDLSENGFGLEIEPTLLGKVNTGAVIQHVDIHLGSTELSGLTLELRHIESVASHPPRIGAKIVSASETHYQELRRLVLAHQRSSRRYG